MKLHLKKSLLSAAIGSLVLSTSVHATNGYFSDGTGAKSRGMGGAGVALAQEAGSMALNPAAAVNMGARLDVGIGLFSPKPRSYSIVGNDLGLGSPNGVEESKSNAFPIPFFGMNQKIDDNSSWGVTVTALGGMNSNYTNNPFNSFHPLNDPTNPAFTGTGDFGALGVDLKQVTVSGVYARKVNSQLSVGIAAGITFATFQARGLAPFSPFSVDPANLTNSNGHDTSSGLALKLGLTYEISKEMTFGFAYSPETDMSNFSKYRGLFAENGDFDIPSNYTLGIAYQMSPKVLIAADYLKINYTDVAAISNDSQRLTDLGPAGSGTSCATTNPFTGAGSQFCLGGSQGAGFGWDDVGVLKVGVAYEQSSDLTLRAGWNHGDNPIGTEDAVINIVAPATVSDHLTLGFTKKLDSSSDITVDFIHTFEAKVTGNIPLAFSTVRFGNTLSASPGTATISMEQNFLEVQYGKRF